MKKYHLLVVLGVLSMVVWGIPALAEDKKAGDFLIDALLGAGEGAIVGEASGGKAGKGALVGAGTALGREVIVKPLLKGGLQGGAPPAGGVTRSRVVEEEPIDPYTKGYQDGFKEGYNQGYKAGIGASQSQR